MKIKKRIFSLFFISIIMFTSINISYKEASATGLEMGWVAPVVGGGISTGGAILLVAALCGAYLGVQYTVTNWDSISSGIGNAYNESTGAVKTWWDDITGKSVSVDDPTKTLKTAIANGETVDMFKYYLPENGGVDVNKEIADYTKAAIEDWANYKSLTKGTVKQTYNGRVAELQKVFEQYNVPFSDSYEFLNSSIMKSVTVIKCGNYFDVIASPYNGVSFFLDYRTVNSVIESAVFMSYGSRYTRYKFSTGTYQGAEYYTGGSLSSSYQNNDGSLFVYDNTQSIASASAICLGSIPNITKQYYLNRSNLRSLDSLIYYTNSDNLNKAFIYDKYFNTIEFINMQYDYTIDDSPYELTLDNPISITANAYLIDEIGAIDITHPGTIGLIDGAIVAADKAAEIAGTNVISTNIVDTSIVNNPPVEGEVESNGWLDQIGSIITGAIQDAFEWLLVPSDTRVDEFVIHCQNTMESESGLLTYPLTLVVEFLIKVGQLGTTDCILHIPKIEIFGQVLYGGTDFNFTNEINKTAYSALYSTYLLLTDFIMIVAFLNLSVDRGREFMTGGLSK